jgi:hypothetical protein
MEHRNRWLAAGLLAAAVPMAGCGAKPSSFDNEPAGNGGAAKVETVKGVERIVLSAKAAQRLGIATGRVTREHIRGASRMVIPYAAVLYDANGRAFTFTSPSPLVFVERPISIDYIKGKQAVLKGAGLPVGANVVTIGSAELLGTARGVEEE